MTFLNKNQFLSLVWVFLFATATVVPCPPDSPEIELFRKEWSDALRTHSGKSVSHIIKKHSALVCSVDTAAALMVAQGYILGQLTFKRHVLETHAITASEHKNALLQEVSDLKNTYANLEKLQKRFPRADRDMFDVFHEGIAMPMYKELLNAVHAHSLTSIDEIVARHGVHYNESHTDQKKIDTTLKLTLIYAVALCELNDQDATAIRSKDSEILEAIRSRLEDIVDTMAQKHDEIA